MKITRDVVADLWPLYACGEASADSRTLVEEFLRDDPEFGQRLRDERTLPLEVPTVAPDVEALAFARARRRLRGFPWLFYFAMMFSCFAFGRIVSDTSWDVSPRNFIITTSIAVAFWIAYFVSLWRMRKMILVVRKPRERG